MSSHGKSHAESSNAPAEVLQTPMICCERQQPCQPSDGAGVLPQLQSSAEQASPQQQMQDVPKTSADFLQIRQHTQQLSPQRKRSFLGRQHNRQRPPASQDLVASSIQANPRHQEETYEHQNDALRLMAENQVEQDAAAIHQIMSFLSTDVLEEHQQQQLPPDKEHQRKQDQCCQSTQDQVQLRKQQQRPKQQEQSQEDQPISEAHLACAKQHEICMVQSGPKIVKPVIELQKEQHLQDTRKLNCASQRLESVRIQRDSSPVHAQASRQLQKKPRGKPHPTEPEFSLNACSKDGHVPQQREHLSGDQQQKAVAAQPFTDKAELLEQVNQQTKLSRKQQKEVQLRHSQQTEELKHLHSMQIDDLKQRHMKDTNDLVADIYQQIGLPPLPQQFFEAPQRHAKGAQHQYLRKLHASPMKEADIHAVMQQQMLMNHREEAFLVEQEKERQKQILAEKQLYKERLLAAGLPAPPDKPKRRPLNHRQQHLRQERGLQGLRERQLQEQLRLVTQNEECEDLEFNEQSPTHGAVLQTPARSFEEPLQQQETVLQQHQARPQQRLHALQSVPQPLSSPELQPVELHLQQRLSSACLQSLEMPLHRASLLQQTQQEGQQRQGEQLQLQEPLPPRGSAEEATNADSQTQPPLPPIHPHVLQQLQQIHALLQKLQRETMGTDGNSDEWPHPQEHPSSPQPQQVQRHTLPHPKADAQQGFREGMPGQGGSAALRHQELHVQLDSETTARAERLCSSAETLHALLASSTARHPLLPDMKGLQERNSSEVIRDSQRAYHVEQQHPLENQKAVQGQRQDWQRQEAQRMHEASAEQRRLALLLCACSVPERSPITAQASLERHIANRAVSERQPQQESEKGGTAHQPSTAADGQTLVRSVSASENPSPRKQTLHRHECPPEPTACSEMQSPLGRLHPDMLLHPMLQTDLQHAGRLVPTSSVYEEQLRLLQQRSSHRLAKQDDTASPSPPKHTQQVLEDAQPQPPQCHQEAIQRLPLAYLIRQADAQQRLSEQQKPVEEEQPLQPLLQLLPLCLQQQHQQGTSRSQGGYQGGDDFRQHPDILTDYNRERIQMLQQSHAATPEAIQHQQKGKEEHSPDMPAKAMDRIRHHMQLQLQHLQQVHCHQKWQMAKLHTMQNNQLQLQQKQHIQLLSAHPKMKQRLETQHKKMRGILQQHHQGRVVAMSVRQQAELGTLQHQHQQYNRSLERGVSQPQVLQQQTEVLPPAQIVRAAACMSQGRLHEEQRQIHCMQQPFRQAPAQGSLHLEQKQQQQAAEPQTHAGLWPPLSEAHRRRIQAAFNFLLKRHQGVAECSRQPLVHQPHEQQQQHVMPPIGREEAGALQFDESGQHPMRQALEDHFLKIVEHQAVLGIQGERLLRLAATHHEVETGNTDKCSGNPTHAGGSSSNSSSRRRQSMDCMADGSKYSSSECSTRPYPTSAAACGGGGQALMSQLAGTTLGRPGEDLQAARCRTNMPFQPPAPALHDEILQGSAPDRKTVLRGIVELLQQCDACFALPQVDVKPFVKFVMHIVDPQDQVEALQELEAQQRLQESLLEALRELSAKTEDLLCQYPEFLVEVATLRQRAQDRDLQELVIGNSMEMKNAVKALAVDTLQILPPGSETPCMRAIKRIAVTGGTMECLKGSSAAVSGLWRDLETPLSLFQTPEELFMACPPLQCHPSPPAAPLNAVPSGAYPGSRYLAPLHPPLPPSHEPAMLEDDDQDDDVEGRRAPLRTLRADPSKPVEASDAVATLDASESTRPFRGAGRACRARHAQDSRLYSRQEVWQLERHLVVQHQERLLKEHHMQKEGTKQGFLTAPTRQLRGNQTRLRGRKRKGSKASAKLSPPGVTFSAAAASPAGRRFSSTSSKPPLFEAAANACRRSASEPLEAALAQRSEREGFSSGVPGSLAAAAAAAAAADPRASYMPRGPWTKDDIGSSFKPSQETNRSQSSNEGDSLYPSEMPFPAKLIRGVDDDLNPPGATAAGLAAVDTLMGTSSAAEDSSEDASAGEALKVVFDRKAHGEVSKSGAPLHAFADMLQQPLPSFAASTDRRLGKHESRVGAAGHPDGDAETLEDREKAFSCREGFFPGGVAACEGQQHHEEPMEPPNRGLSEQHRAHREELLEADVRKASPTSSRGSLFCEVNVLEARKDKFSPASLGDQQINTHDKEGSGSNFFYGQLFQGKDTLAAVPKPAESATDAAIPREYAQTSADESAAAKKERSSADSARKRMAPSLVVEEEMCDTQKSKRRRLSPS
ncbi:hypothetical protein cyc_02730 [Cyclospora cayetanensis]|uniref:Uncharacterized protein n=1 Tax=Cyclospora cayetanensis TaxID=88456 RepID=A0A1D3CYB4_9EIME|nr:hypothetical protein cyc_02730 [Cyclospora cayetanensis]